MTGTEEREARLFVSHHSSTYDVALHVEELLRARGVSCWIAPRDVEPGEPFDKAIRNAILGSSGILLLFTEKSDRSRHVKRELILADSAARPIIPLRLENIDPGELAYHLADSQWIDWIDRREAVMDRVANQAREYARIAPAIDAPIPHTHRLRADEGRRQDKPWIWVAGAAALLVAVVAVTWLLATRGDDRPTEPGVPEVTQGDQQEVVEAIGDEPDEAAPEEAAEQSPAEPPPPTSRPTVRPTLTTAPPRLVPPVRATRVAQPTAVVTAAPTGPLQRVVSACRGAESDTAYLICADRRLGATAREMTGLIAQVRDSLADDPDGLRTFNIEQREWFVQMSAECHNADCVAQGQATRMAQLQRMIGQ